MFVKTCSPYHGELNQRRTLRMPDGLSVYKTYFISITGREDPTRYEWSVCRLTPPETEKLLMASNMTGVGFITAFPHITKFFRFAPGIETVLHVRAFETVGLKPLTLDREDGFTEYACLAEALIAADEYKAWAGAGDVPAYLKEWSSWQRGAVVNHAKLAAYTHAETARQCHSATDR